MRRPGQNTPLRAMITNALVPGEQVPAGDIAERIGKDRATISAACSSMAKDYKLKRVALAGNKRHRARWAYSLGDAPVPTSGAGWDMTVVDEWFRILDAQLKIQRAQQPPTEGDETCLIWPARTASCNT